MWKRASLISADMLWLNNIVLFIRFKNANKLVYFDGEGRIGTKQKNSVQFKKMEKAIVKNTETG